MKRFGLICAAALAVSPALAAGKGDRAKDIKNYAWINVVAATAANICPHVKVNYAYILATRIQYHFKDAEEAKIDKEIEDQKAEVIAQVVTQGEKAWCKLATGILLAGGVLKED